MYGPEYNNAVHLYTQHQTKRNKRLKQCKLGGRTDTPRLQTITKP